MINIQDITDLPIAYEAYERPEYITVDGPFPQQDRYGEEYPVWTVTLCDADDCDITSHDFHSLEEANENGEEIARRLKIECASDAGYP